jgi:hypothetical protein
MDPDANLKELISLAQAMLRTADRDESPIDPDDAVRLAELVLALDGWLLNRGALPAVWAMHQGARDV